MFIYYYWKKNRQWNEHKTVVELWGHLDKPPESPTAPPSTPVVSPSLSGSGGAAATNGAPMKGSRSMDCLSLDSSGSIVDPPKRKFRSNNNIDFARFFENGANLHQTQKFGAIFKKARETV